MQKSIAMMFNSCYFGQGSMIPAFGRFKTLLPLIIILSEERLVKSLDGCLVCVVVIRHCLDRKQNITRDAAKLASLQLWPVVSLDIAISRCGCVVMSLMSLSNLMRVNMLHNILHFWLHNVYICPHNYMRILQQTFSFDSQWQSLCWGIICPQTYRELFLAELLTHSVTFNWIFPPSLFPHDHPRLFFGIKWNMTVTFVTLCLKKEWMYYHGPQTIS